LLLVGRAFLEELGTNGLGWKDGKDHPSIHLSWYTSGCCFTLALVSGPFVTLGRPLLLLLRPYGTLKKLWPVVHQWTGSLVWNEAFVLITLVTASTLTTRVVSSWDWNSQQAWLHSLTLSHWSKLKVYVLSLKMQLWTPDITRVVHKWL
jgi:hypothetical protein